MQDRTHERPLSLGAVGGMLLLSVAVGCSGTETLTSPTAILPSGDDNILLAAGVLRS
jgi:hypothetical protein